MTGDVPLITMPDGRVLHSVGPVERTAVPGGTFDIQLLETDLSLLERTEPPVAIDGDPAVAEVRVLGHQALVSSEMLADTAQLRAALRAMAEGRPLPVMRLAVEQRKDRAALARLRYGRLMLVASRRPDPAIARMLRPHRPVTHSIFNGEVETRPWCQVCGSEDEYPCYPAQMVAEAIDHRID